MLVQSRPSLSALPLLLSLLLLLTLVAPSHSAAVPRFLPATKSLKRPRADAANAWTNAQRLAAGLPPKAPRHIKRATPTVQNLALRNAPSPSPSAFVNLALPEKRSHTGLIEARLPNSATSLGFVRVSSSDVVLGNGVDDGTRVAFTTLGSTPFSIATQIGSDDDAPAYIGARGRQAIHPGSARTATLGTVRLTAPHARPMATGGESAIWTLDGATQRLVPYWVNPDGSHARTAVAYSARANALVLTGEGGVGAYNEAHPDAPVVEVALHFVGRQ